MPCLKFAWAGLKMLSPFFTCILFPVHQFFPQFGCPGQEFIYVDPARLLVKNPCRGSSTGSVFFRGRFASPVHFRHFFKHLLDKGKIKRQIVMEAAGLIGPNRSLSAIAVPVNNRLTNGRITTSKGCFFRLNSILTNFAAFGPVNFYLHVYFLNYYMALARSY